VQTLSTYPAKRLCGILIALATAASVQLHAAKKLSDRLDSLLNTWTTIPGLQPAQWGISVWDATQMKEIGGKNQNTLLIPASIQKILTSFAALETFGSTYRYSTTVGHTGKIDADGVLNGNLIIIGSGDPSLGSRKFSATQSDKLLNLIVNTVTRAGIKQISGNIIADASLFSLPLANWSWSWEDLGAYYGAGASAIAYRDNYAQLFLRPIQSTGSWEWNWEKPAPTGITIENLLETGPAKGKNQVRILGTEFQTTRILSGVVRADERQLALRVSLPNPALALAQGLYDALSDSGIEVKGQAEAKYSGPQPYSSVTPLLAVKSPTLIELITEVNKESNNLYAEHLFKSMGSEQFGKGNSETGKLSLQRFWTGKGLVERELVLEDGSGLSRYNAISAGNMTKALVYIATSPIFTEFLTTLPRSGMEGTLKNVGTANQQKGKVWAKSGSMSKVRAYAGFTYHSNGSLICFTLMLNQHALSGKELKELTESFWNLLLT